MLCSKPAATNAAIGGMMMTTLSTVVRALKHIHTAMHTSALHMMPSVSAGTKSSAALLLAVTSADNPTAPPPKVYCAVKNISAAVPSAPMQFPMNTTSQLVSILRVRTLPLAHAMTIRLLPVNSSAPATTTMISPDAKTTPVNNLVTPY